MSQALASIIPFFKVRSTPPKRTQLLLLSLRLSLPEILEQAAVHIHRNCNIISSGGWKLCFFTIPPHVRRFLIDISQSLWFRVVSFRAYPVRFLFSVLDWDWYSGEVKEAILSVVVLLACPGGPFSFLLLLFFLAKHEVSGWFPSRFMFIMVAKRTKCWSVTSPDFSTLQNEQKQSEQERILRIQYSLSSREMEG